MGNYDANDLKSTLVYIKNNFGLEVFSKQGRVTALLSDLAPSLKKEKSMLGRMDKAGMLKELIASQNMSEAQRKHNVSLILKKLIENDFIQPKIAREYVSLFIDVLGLSIDIPIVTSEELETTKKLKVKSEIILEDKSVATPSEHSSVPKVVTRSRQILLAQPARAKKKYDFTHISFIVAICLLFVFLFTLGKNSVFNSDYRRTLEHAEQGDLKAQTDLGDMYYNGKVVKQDYAEALKWYRKAAEHGYMVAQDKLGDMYRDGVGVKTDYEEAWKWYRLSVAQGYRGAQASYGVMYKNGYGVEKDYAKAIEWYSKAIAQGDLVCMNSVGNLYWEGGYGIEQNYTRAVEYYLKAAEQGYDWAQNNLGNAYFNGKGVKQDYSEAVKWYHRAADQGLAEAQNSLGIMYHDGNGVRQDYQEAIRWFKKAAEQGYNWAQNNLGNAYRNGWGVKKDYQEAVKWYRKAADQGLADSQYSLGFMYENALGVNRDIQVATEWYQKAAGKGYEDAKKAITRLQVGKFSVLDTPNFDIANGRIHMEFIGAFRGGNPDGTRQYGRQSTTGVLFYFVATSHRKDTEIRIDQNDLFDKKGKKFDTRGWSSIIGQSTATRKRLTVNRPTLVGFGFHMPASESEELPTIDSVRFQFNGQWYEIRNIKVRTWAEWEAIRDRRGLR